MLACVMHAGMCSMLLAADVYGACMLLWSVPGHSMGGGTAAILTMMLRTSEACASHPAFATACCYAIACPSCMTLELAQSCR